MTVQISWSTDSISSDDASGENVLTTAFHLLAFDAVMAEDHEEESELTDHVIETREAISDHKRPKPQTLRMEAIITNTPLAAPPPSGFGSVTPSAEVRKSVGSAKANVVVFSEEFDRVGDAIETLNRLRREAIDLTVETSTRTYENMQLIQVRRARAGGEDATDAASVDLVFREVFRGETITVDAPVPREPRGAPRSETATEPEAEDTTDQSWLLEAVGML